MNFVNYLIQYSPLKDDDDLSSILVYKHFIAKERLLHKTLNQFKVVDRLLVGLVWVPVKYEEALMMKKDEM